MRGGGRSRSARAPGVIAAGAPYFLVMNIAASFDAIGQAAIMRCICAMFIRPAGLLIAILSDVVLWADAVPAPSASRATAAARANVLVCFICEVS